MVEKTVTEITSYCGDTYQKVELAHSTFYHRIKRKDDTAFLPSTNNLSLAVSEVDLLRADIDRVTAERDRYKRAYGYLMDHNVLTPAVKKEARSKAEAVRG